MFYALAWDALARRRLRSASNRPSSTSARGLCGWMTVDRCVPGHGDHIRRVICVSSSTQRAAPETPPLGGCCARRYVCVMRWTVHGERTIYDSEWLQLALTDVEVPGGRRFEHHVVRMPDKAAGAVVHDRDR